jgi:hypothetical protein
MFKEIQIEKVVLLGITYLTLLSICYNNGYWSLFKINVFNYYGVQDILKGAVAPLFQFGGLLALPILVVFILALLLFKKINEEAQKEAQKDNERKSEVKFGKLQTIALGIFAIIVIPCVIAVLIISPFLLFPIEEQGDFALLYLNSIPGPSVGRALLVCTILPVYWSLFFNVIKLLTKEQAFKGIFILSSFSSTFLIAYHYGRLDAFKIVSGYEFRYWVDENKLPHKYIAKVNNYNMFLEDRHYVLHNDSLNFRLDTLHYVPLINVISEDSLKGLSLEYYHAANTSGESGYFSRVFAPIRKK